MVRSPFFWVGVGIGFTFVSGCAAERRFNELRDSYWSLFNTKVQLKIENKKLRDQLLEKKEQENDDTGNP